MLAHTGTVNQSCARGMTVESRVESRVIAFSSDRVLSQVASHQSQIRVLASRRAYLCITPSVDAIAFTTVPKLAFCIETSHYHLPLQLLINNYVNPRSEIVLNIFHSKHGKTFDWINRLHNS